MRASLKDKLSSLPLKPGVYLFKDKRGEILYVGKAKSLRKRVLSYFRKPADLKTSILLSRLFDIDYRVMGSEMEALLLEDELIKKHKPRYNVSLRDDKSYPFIKLTVNEEWPRLFLARRKEEDGALYFGRFQGGMVRAALRLIKKIFPIRWCLESPLLMREQPCLYYRIGSCSGPCIGKINQRDYRALVSGIIYLLKGRMKGALLKLNFEMEKASKALDFERAAYLRDRIKILRKMMEEKRLDKEYSPRLPLEISDLKRALRLTNLPMRIEAFDVSNIQGTDIVGSMIVFHGGLPLKKDYRKFKIKATQGKPDDSASIYEIVKRRYTGSLSKALEVPDLVLIDGGKAQVNSGARGLKEAGLEKISVIGLAKKKEEIFIFGHRKPLRLAKDSPALQILQRIRDEAHRFAVSYHRLMRKRNFYQ